MTYVLIGNPLDGSLADGLSGKRYKLEEAHTMIGAGCKPLDPLVPRLCQGPSSHPFGLCTVVRDFRLSGERPRLSQSPAIAPVRCRISLDRATRNWLPGMYLEMRHAASGRRARDLGSEI